MINSPEAFSAPGCWSRFPSEATELTALPKQGSQTEEEKVTEENSSSESPLQDHSIVFLHTPLSKRLELVVVVSNALEKLAVNWARRVYEFLILLPGSLSIR